MLNKLQKNTAKFLLFFTLSLPFSIIVAETNKLPIISGVGGNFSAINGEGNNIEFKDYAGKVIVLAFGYTNCADICPFTLGYLKQLYNELLEDEKKQTNIIFVTIDPQYDTPKHLNEFVHFFNKDFIGLSGSKEQIATITSLYQAEFSDLSKEKVTTKSIRRTTPQKSDDENEKASLFSHTVILYLIDKKGLTRSLEYTGTPKKDFARKIRSLLNE